MISLIALEQKDCNPVIQILLKLWCQKMNFYQVLDRAWNFNPFDHEGQFLVI